MQDDYEPLNKIRYRHTSDDDIDDDIDDILSEMMFSHELLSPPEESLFDWPESLGEKTEINASEEAIKDTLNEAVVPDNEVTAYPSDDDYITSLLMNRNNLTLVKLHDKNVSQNSKNIFNEDFSELISPETSITIKRFNKSEKTSFHNWNDSILMETN